MQSSFYYSFKNKSTKESNCQKSLKLQPYYTSIKGLNN